MHWIDQTEKLGRLVLWLALSSACVLAPISYARARMSEAERRETARAQERADVKAKEAELRADKTAKVLSIGSMGVYMSALNLLSSSASVWFTNASPRTGVVCLMGTATNQTSHANVTSLVECHQVAAYESDVHMQFIFAGSELKAACPSAGVCETSFQDVPAAR